MKRKFALCAAALCLTMALSPAALAAEAAQVCYPTSVTRSEDGAEIRKYYDLGPEEDPAGIPGPILSRMASATPSPTC